MSGFDCFPVSLLVNSVVPYSDIGSLVHLLMLAKALHIILSEPINQRIYRILIDTTLHEEFDTDPLSRRKYDTRAQAYVQVCRTTSIKIEVIGKHSIAMVEGMQVGMFDGQLWVAFLRQRRLLAASLHWI